MISAANNCLPPAPKPGGGGGGKPGICYLGDKPHSPNLSDLAECVIVMVAIPWKSLLPSGKHLSDAG
jgi:hypothetical protein